METLVLVRYEIWISTSWLSQINLLGLCLFVFHLLCLCSLSWLLRLIFFLAVCGVFLLSLDSSVLVAVEFFRIIFVPHWSLVSGGQKLS